MRRPRLPSPVRKGSPAYAVPVRSARSLLRLGLALGAAPAHLHAQAQATTGVIRGTVTDSPGRTLAGASVTLRNAETNAERVLTTNERGVYVATLLRVGTYDVTARALGFREEKRTGLALRLGETLDLPFALAPQAVQLQEITVAGVEPTVDVTNSASATRLGVEAVEGLPNNGRNIFNFTTLTPNVAIVQGPDGDEISIGGQRGIHNNVSVDGADFNNPVLRRAARRPAAGLHVQSRRGAGIRGRGRRRQCRVRAVERRLRQRHHQVGHQRVPRLGALLRQVRRALGGFSHTFANGTTSGFSPDFTQHQFGGTLGGPLVRDKAFFFLAYDQQEYNETKQTGPAEPDRSRRCWPSWTPPSAARCGTTSGRSRAPTTPTPCWPSSTSG